MRFDQELARLADLLRVGAETARMIARERERDEAAILALAAQADTMAEQLDRMVSSDPSQPDASLRLRRDR